jgi:hypothetical protein
MPAKLYSVEQIVAKLREHEKLQGQGVGCVKSVEFETRPNLVAAGLV